ncbi:non-receptor serine/threonine protein kinase [Lithospermum erythrorhizon]|uniref:Non-receptor serine/threonine protein kinase n=1 Tax=Lithospermum erythrorhizon TaxID=34254 RepID=A0AAV3PD81_LITER
MKSFLKKLHIGSNQSDDSEDSTSSSKGNKLIDVSLPERVSQKWSHHSSELKPFSAIQGWLNSVTHKNIPTPLSSSNLGREEKMEPSDSVSSSALEAALEAVRRDSENSNDRDPDIEEEYQIQLALELSAREDPEAVQIEAVKQISLRSCATENTPAEVVAYRYWNYNSLGYDDKILDGFYDLYGVLLEPASSTMPSLVDLQQTPVSDNISWEAILVNRAGDSKLLNIEQKALDMALKSRTVLMNNPGACLVKDVAALVSNHMGGPVKDPDSMLMAWRSFCYNLKTRIGSMVLPLGSLKVGLARHRALLFKVLADSVGIPCRLVKGQQYTGSDDVAVNFVKIDDGREYIVDLMADPGTLIPSDAAAGHVDYGEPFLSVSPLSRGADFSQVASSSSEVTSSFEENSGLGGDKHSGSGNESSSQSDYLPHGNAPFIIQAKEDNSKISSHNFKKPHYSKKDSSQGIPHKTTHPYSHVRSPSWTEGVSSPAVRRMKVKDVSQYMIDAAKENPQLAQKLHDVLLESGVAAPPNLFTEIYHDELDILALDTTSPREDMEIQERDESKRNESRDGHDQPRFLPPLPHHGIRSKAQHGRGRKQNLRETTEEHVVLESESSPVKHTKNVPVAAAAVAAAAVVASSMVVSTGKTGVDSNIEIPVAAAATATAAAVVATTAAASKQYESSESSPPSPDSTMKDTKIDKENEVIARDQRGSGEKDHENWGTISDGERISDRSTGSTKSETTFDDVSDCEIPYEDITLGERIGIGSYGEVYHGDWHGTEVAVKRFLDQGITSESLEEFKSEV